MHLLFLLLIPTLTSAATRHTDQLTLLISGYSHNRLPLLRRLALSYSSHPQIHTILILWHNPIPPPPNSLPPEFPLLLLPNSSLNLRFLPRPLLLPTRALAFSDDDLLLPPASLSLALRLFLQHPPQSSPLVGFFARSHLLDLPSRRWLYASLPDRYSIILTKFLILDSKYLDLYHSPKYARAREVVDRERNCEDILMNFVVAIEGGGAPVLVDGRVRDWGDPRNRNGSSGVAYGEGLSRRKGHRKKRGDCIHEFHRLLGEMPLRYSYGKVVADVGEQGICDKGGKLVNCDRDE